MAEAKAVQCDGCGKFQQLLDPISTTGPGWLVLFGAVDGVRRHDFCSVPCLYRWVPKLVTAEARRAAAESQALMARDD